MGIESMPTGGQKAPDQEPKKEMSAMELLNFFADECRKLRMEYVPSIGRDALDIVTEWDERAYDKPWNKERADYLLKRMRDELEDRKKFIEKYKDSKKMSS